MYVTTTYKHITVFNKDNRHTRKHTVDCYPIQHIHFTV